MDFNTLMEKFGEASLQAAQDSRLQEPIDEEQAKRRKEIAAIS
jgi:hypothetical protein